MSTDKDYVVRKEKHFTEMRDVSSILEWLNDKTTLDSDWYEMCKQANQNEKTNCLLALLKGLSEQNNKISNYWYLAVQAWDDKDRMAEWRTAFVEKLSTLSIDSLAHWFANDLKHFELNDLTFDWIEKILSLYQNSNEDSFYDGEESL